MTKLAPRIPGPNLSKLSAGLSGKQKKNLAAAIGVVVVVAFILVIFSSQGILQGPKEYHSHADFAVYIGDVQYNFSRPGFMSTTSKPLSSSVHLHDLNGTVIHTHAKGVTLGDFFKSIGMGLDSNCFVAETGTFYCTGEGRELAMFVNGERSQGYGDYVIQDNDRILLSYGDASEGQLKQQMSSVTNYSCIFSWTCPQRGKPPAEG